jgi:hypothetical protein
VCLEFVPDASCSGEVRARLGTGSTCDAVVIDVAVDPSATGVFGAKFTLVQDFDHSILFGSNVSAANSFLDDDGAEVLVVAQISETDPETLLVTITRQGVTTPGRDPVAGADPPKDVLGTLTYVRLGISGSATVTFDDAQLFDPGTPPTPKTGVTFCGGTLEINPV